MVPWNPVNEINRLAKWVWSMVSSRASVGGRWGGRGPQEAFVVYLAVEARLCVAPGDTRVLAKCRASAIFAPPPPTGEMVLKNSYKEQKRSQELT